MGDWSACTGSPDGGEPGAPVVHGNGGGPAWAKMALEIGRDQSPAQNIGPKISMPERVSERRP